MGRCSYVIKVEQYGALMKRAWSVVDQGPIFIFSGCNATVLEICGFSCRLMKYIFIRFAM